MTTEITEDTFDQIIDGNTNVLVDCWAPWCGPCRRLGPIIDEIASEYGSQVKVVKLNVDDAPGISARFNINAIPTVESRDRELHILEGDIPSPVNPPKGCKFHTRCDRCMEICKHIVPEWQEVEPGHWCACHLIDQNKE